MTYSPQTWLNGSGGGTPISADRLNYIEQGVVVAAAGSSSGGATISNQLLIDWTLGETFRLATATYDGNGILATATVVWPDTSGGALTVTATDVPSHSVNAYMITHTLSGKTVTQSAVTRDGSGNVTVTPALVVS